MRVVILAAYTDNERLATYIRDRFAEKANELTNAIPGEVEAVVHPGGIPRPAESARQIAPIRRIELHLVWTGPLTGHPKRQGFDTPIHRLSSVTISSQPRTAEGMIAVRATHESKGIRSSPSAPSRAQGLANLAVCDDQRGDTLPAIGLQGP